MATTNELEDIELTAEGIYKEYTDSIAFDNSFSFYDEVKENRRFRIGDQWNGVDSGNLSKPVLNVIGLVGNHHVASIQSNDVNFTVTPFYKSDEEVTQACNIVNSELSKNIELCRLKEKFREMESEAFDSGNFAMYWYSDVNKIREDKYKTTLYAEVLDPTQVYFGNPYDKEVESQPWIIIVQRLYLDQVKKYAEKNGISSDVIDGMSADDDQSQMNEDTTKNVLKTLITKFYRVSSGDNATIHFTQCTKEAIIREDTDLGYQYYPVVYGQWAERNKYNYRGYSPITPVKPNQLMINKLLALELYYAQNMAFPFVLADKTKLRKIMSNVLGSDSTGAKVITTPNIELTGKVMDFIKAPDFSDQVAVTIDKLYEYTKECMGISDANLGNVKPDNTSAIIALQDSTMLPLQIQIRNFYKAYESCARIMLDMMSVDYGSREVEVISTDATTGITTTEIQNYNFNDLADMNLNVNVDVGDSQYWSEITQIQTLDNMLAKGLITNPIDYLERIPDKYITNKKGLIDTLKQAQQQALQTTGQTVSTNAQLQGDYATAEALAQIQNQGNQEETNVLQ